MKKLADRNPIMSLGKMLAESAGIYGERVAVIHGETDHLSGTGPGGMRPGEPPAVAGSRQGGQGGRDAPQLSGVHHSLFRSPEDRRRRRDAQCPIHTLRTATPPRKQRCPLPDHPGLPSRSVSMRSGNNFPSATTSSRPTVRRRIPPSGRSSTKGPFTDGDPGASRTDDPAVMIYTAGLTGKPLGAVLTHHNLLTQSLLLRTDLPTERGGHRARRHPLFPLLRGRGQYAVTPPDRRRGRPDGTFHA